MESLQLTPKGFALPLGQSVTSVISIYKWTLNFQHELIEVMFIVHLHWFAAANFSLPKIRLCTLCQ